MRIGGLKMLFTLAAWHGALTVGLTTYPALESRFALTNEAIPAVTIDLVAQDPIGKPEPLTLKAGIHLKVWAF